MSIKKNTNSELGFNNTSDEVLIQELLDNSESSTSKQSVVMKCFIDTEYCTQGPLSIQAKITGSFPFARQTLNGLEEVLEDLNLKIIILDVGHQLLFTPELLELFKKENSCYIFFKDISKGTDSYILDAFLEILYTELHYVSSDPFGDALSIQFYYYFYFSPKDVSFPLGTQIIAKVYSDKKNLVSQHRSINGRFYLLNSNFPQQFRFHIILKDFFGLDKSGLEKMAISYGILFEKNKDLDKYKSNMVLAMQVMPYEFLLYGLKDALVLEDLLLKIVGSFNLLLSETLNIKNPDMQFTTSKIPFTLGSLVNNIFHKYMENKFYSNNVLLKVIIHSHGILNPRSLSYESDKQMLNLILKAKSKKHLNQIVNGTYPFNKGSFRFLPHSYGSIKYLFSITSNTNLYTSASVTGGRVVNENPIDVFFMFGADLDIVSAYGEILRQLALPMGHPTIECNGDNSLGEFTLGSLIKKYPELDDEYDITKPAYWKIVVSCKQKQELSFCQDLIFSRISSSKSFQDLYQNIDIDEPDTYFDPGATVLLRKEIVQGTITPVMFDAIKKIASSKELVELKELKVDSMILYSKHDKCNSIEDLGEEYFKDKGKHFFNPETSSNQDTRSKAWYPIEFDEFIGPLIKERKVLKARIKNYYLDLSQEPCPLKKEEILSLIMQLKALDQTLKLVVNTLYGVMCSVWFPLSNVVSADGITSTIRMYAYFMAKALNLHLTVCDGGMCSLNEVFFLKEARKPSLSTLSSAVFMKIKPEDSSVRHRTLKLAPLGGIDWEKEFLNPSQSIHIKNLAPLAYQHLVNFWGAYNIKITFQIELKELILKGTYMLKAHYMIQVYDYGNNCWSNTFRYKIRGFHKREQIIDENPIYALLEFILQNGTLDKKHKFYHTPFTFLENRDYQVEKMLRIKSWKNSFAPQNSSSAGIPAYGSQAMPGDFFQENRVFKLNNTHFPFYNRESYISRTNKSFNKTIVNGVITYGFLYEKFLIYGSLMQMIYQMGNGVIEKNVLKRKPINPNKDLKTLPPPKKKRGKEV